MADTRDMIVRIRGDTTDFEKSMDNVRGKSDDASNSFGKLAGAVATGQAIFGVLTSVLHGAETAIEDVTGFIKDSLGEVTNLGIQVRTLTQETGMNATTTSEWIAVMDRFGITGEQASVSIKTFSKQVEAATGLTTKSSTGFANLGINVNDATGKTKDFNELILEVADRFQTLGPSLDRTAIAVQLFGRQGQNLLPLLNNGRDGIIALETEAQKMGLVLTDQNAGAISNYITKQAEMSEAVSGFKLQIGLGLMPVVTQMIGKVMDWINANGGIAEIVQTRVMPVLNIVIAWVKDFVTNHLPGIIKGLEGLGKFLEVTGAIFGSVFGFIDDCVRSWGNQFATEIWDVILTFQMLIDFIRKIPGWTRDAFSGLVGLIVGPFRTAFNAIADLWNGTVGKLDFKAPSWVPGIGGKGFSMPQIPHLAEGGIVTRPTVALIGEAGPEAVVPLNKAGGAGGINITVNMGMYAGMPVEKREIALSMYKELVRAARSNGVNLPLIPAVGIQ